jgi:hypothetical protein
MVSGMMKPASPCRSRLRWRWGRNSRLDLDTPLLMDADPHEGGYGYEGPRLTVWSRPGIDLKPSAQPAL